MMKMKKMIRRISSYKKYIVVGVIALSVVGISVYMTISFLSSQSALDNQFQIASVQPEVIETFENNVKEDVCVRNSGDIPVYIRAKIMIYYQDDKGNILGPVQDADYLIDYPDDLDSYWIQADDGFYYYKNKIDAKKQTSYIIDTCKTSDSLDDRKLVVDIVAEAIQANPKEAVEEAWKAVDVDSNGTLIEAGVTNP